MKVARILIVEDEYIVGLQLKEQLERLGYSVCSLVSSGREAVEAARSYEPDAILVDIFLKGDMDGIDAAEKIRSERITPVVYITGRQEDESFQRARRTLPQGYLVKPLRDRELKIAIDMALTIGEAEARRGEAEAALRESEQKYRELVENINEVSFSLDREGRFTYISPVIERKTGFQPDHFLGRHFSEFIQPEDVAGVQSRLAGILKGAVREIEFRYGTQCSQNRWASVSARPRLDENGNVTHYTGLWSEITERKEAEQKLQWELSVNSALSTLSHALISSSYDVEKVSSLILDYARELTGSQHGYVSSIDAKTGDNVGHTLTDMMGEECRLTDAKPSIRFPRGPDGRYPALWGYGLNVREAFYTNEPATHPASTGLPEGHIPLERFLNVPVCFGDELIGQIAVANSIRDYTEKDLTAVSQLAEFYALAVHRERTEQDKERMEKTLHHSRKMEAIGTLAGGVAHDFNNLLHAMQGYTQLVLLDTPMEDPRYASLLQVEKAAKRAAGLITQLLMFSRKVEGRKRPVNLNETVLSVGNLLERTIPKMISIDFQLAPHLPRVNADPNQMEQVLMNLAVNARDAMREGGTITIRTEEMRIESEFAGEAPETPPRDHVVLTFSDTGAGMDKETQEHAFEPFYTTKETGKGTGLGLATVYGIVKSHGGSVVCESEPGVGTTFRIYLPALPSEELEEATAQALRFSEGGKETILLVDDEEPLRELGRQILSRFGYTVITAGDGERALDLFTRDGQAVDLVILDIIMPGMGGLQCLKKLLERDRDARVLIASGYSGGGGADVPLPPGAKGFIRKPYQVDEMLKAVRRALA